MDSEKPTPPIVRCPSCGRMTRYDQSNADRPFCSSRCKTMDIAQWAEESFRIPATESSPGASTDDEEEKFSPPKYGGEDDSN